MDSIPLVDLGRQHRSIAGELRSAYESVLGRGDFILGGALDRFEAAFAEYQGADYGVGVSSGTDALYLALAAHGVGEGDEVLVPAHTFIATALAVVRTGARPIPVDIRPGGFLMDVNAAEAAITPRTAAILPVHLYGEMTPVDPIERLARRFGLLVVEDACQAHGASFQGHRAGSWSDVACFSFYPGKNLGGLGDGGMVLCRSPEVAEKIRTLRNLGQARKNVHDVQGWNSRLDTLQAAFLHVKLGHLDEWNDLRRRHAAEYDRLLVDLPLQRPSPAPEGESVYHLYVVRVQRRDAVLVALQGRGVGAGVHYPTAIPLHPCFAAWGFRQGQFPEAERAVSEVLSLPLFAEIQESEIRHVATVLGESLSAG